MLEIFDLDPKDRLVAQLLMSHGLLTHEDFVRAINRRRESFFLSLAEVIVGQGLVTLEHLETLMHDYCRKVRLGELAIARGLISEQQLEMALTLQEDREVRIGELFIELHFATAEQIEMLLDYQRRWRVEPAAC